MRSRSGGSAALGPQAFFAAGEALLRHARRAGEPLSVMVLELNDLPELECVFGRRVADQLAAITCAKLRRMAGSQGLARRTGPTTFAVLMPDLDIDDVLDAMFDEFGRSCAVELEADGDEVVLVPEFKVQTVRESGSVQGAYETLCHDIANARADKQRYLRGLERERESHSRPMELRPQAPRARPDPLAGSKAPRQFLPPVPPTMPVPMGRR
jgi:GGDEF domain-containing protein